MGNKVDPTVRMPNGVVIFKPTPPRKGDVWSKNCDEIVEELYEQLDPATKKAVDVVNERYAGDPIVKAYLESTKEVKEFCQGCEFVRLLDPNAQGYCVKHGDLNGGPPDDE